MKQLHIATTAAAIIIASATTLTAQSVTDLPSEIANNYVNKIDYSVSDEFNGKRLDANKWIRRNTGGTMVSDHSTDESLVKMLKEKGDDGKDIGYISFIGTSPDGKPKTSGIVSNAASHFGFYVARFRILGLDSEEVKANRTIWHPAIWGANNNDSSKPVRRASKGNWLEIDFVEWETWPNVWSCDAPARFVDSSGKMRKVVTQGKGMEKAVVQEPVKGGRDNTQWCIVGLEYSPEHLVIWEWIDGKWVNTSSRHVTFVDEDPASPESSYTVSTIGKSAAKPQFWILGNVVSRYLYDGINDGTTKYNMDDMSFDIDYFRLYPHKSSVKDVWPWKGGVAGSL